MALSLALNLTTASEGEASYGNHIETIKNCASALKLAKGWRRDIHLFTEMAFASLQMSLSRSLVSFISDRHVREEVRILMALANRAPQINLDSGMEVTHGEATSWAAQLAHENDGLILSLQHAEFWKVNFLSFLVSRISDDGDILKDDVSIENIFDPASCEFHRSVIESRGRSVPPGGAVEIWAQRDVLFPFIRFLARVENDLIAVGNAGSGLSQVYSRLLDIDASIREWSEDKVTYPSWRGNVTGESCTRKQLCNFCDDVGVTHNYETHARFTPGAGRIHFRVVDKERIAEVAYVGAKIEG